MAGETHLHFVDAVSAMTFEPLVTIEALGAVHGPTADRIAGNGFDDARRVAGKSRGDLGEIALQRNGAQLGAGGEDRRLRGSRRRLVQRGDVVAIGVRTGQRAGGAFPDVVDGDAGRLEEPVCRGCCSRWCGSVPSA